MVLSNSRFNIQPSSPRPSHIAQELNQLQADILTVARRQAVDDVGAAMAHQLSEPLTALLLYLHEIKQAEPVPASMREIAAMALRETERVCVIMAQVAHTIEAPVDAETAVARSPEAIGSLTRNGHLKGSGYGSQNMLYAGQRYLTPREHEVLTLITGGASNKEGGQRLGISTRTFEVHRAHLMRKLGARNAADLVRMALSESQ